MSLDITGPVATLSRDLQLSRIVSVTGRSNRQPGGTVGLAHRRGHVPTSQAEDKAHRADRAGRRRPPRPRPNPKHPTAADPLRVLIVGDSIGLDMGGALQSDLAGTGVVTAALDGRESTGLTRPDYFNWPAELTTDLTVGQPAGRRRHDRRQRRPGLPRARPTRPTPRPTGTTLYAQRVAQFMQIAESGGAAVIWVGMPPMQNPALSAQMADLNDVDQHQAPRSPRRR